MKLFEEQQALAERKFQLQQQEKRLKIKSDLIQIAAKEQVYAEADTLERGQRSGAKFELPLLIFMSRFSAVLLLIIFTEIIPKESVTSLKQQN